MLLYKRLLAHPIHTYSYKEARFLLEELETARTLYMNGVSAKTLARQFGLTLSTFNYLMDNYVAFTDKLRIQANKLDQRESTIFDRKYVRSVLEEKQDEIIEYTCLGFKPREIYAKIGVLPSKATWNSFLTRLKRAGYDLKEMRKEAEQDGFVDDYEMIG